MIASDWTQIPKRLADAGYAVCYSRVSYDPERPLWSARAGRAGREWTTLGEDLCSAFVELERQTAATGDDWRRLIGHEAQAARLAAESA